MGEFEKFNDNSARRLLEYALSRCQNNSEYDIMTLLSMATLDLKNFSLYNDSNKDEYSILDLFEFERIPNQTERLNRIPINTYFIRSVSDIAIQMLNDMTIHKCYLISDTAPKLSWAAYVNSIKYEIQKDGAVYLSHIPNDMMILGKDDLFYYFVWTSSTRVGSYAVGKLDAAMIDSIDTLDYILIHSINDLYEDSSRMYAELKCRYFVY